MLKDGTQTTTAIVPFVLGISQFGYTTGTFTTPTFDSARFTANGSMTWTVASGDVTTDAYTLQNKMMTYIFAIETTTVGGTLNNNLIITLPASKTSAKRVLIPVVIFDNSSSVATAGYGILSASGTYIAISKSDGSNFTASTNVTSVYGSITFETT